MQKHILLNTLLLIGAICLSTRGVAQTTDDVLKDKQPQMQTQTANPNNQPAQIDQNVDPLQSNEYFDSTNVPTSTNTVNPGNELTTEDSSEDMD